MKQKIAISLMASLSAILIPALALAQVATSTNASATSTPDSATSTVTSGLQFNDLTGSQNINSSSSTPLGLQMAAPQYPNGPRLIKLDGGDTLYWVNANNFKIIVPNSAAVLKSYGITASSATAVTEDELSYYGDSLYIRLNGNARIYKLEGKNKRFVPSNVWSHAEVDPAAIIDVNKTEFNYYKTGPAIKTLDDLEIVQ
jgi:hypothetical protein